MEGALNYQLRDRIIDGPSYRFRFYRAINITRHSCSSYSLISLHLPRAEAQSSFRFKDYKNWFLFSAHVSHPHVFAQERFLQTQNRKRRRRRRSHPRPRAGEKKETRGLLRGYVTPRVPLIGIPDSKSRARGERRRARREGREEGENERNFPCSNFFLRWTSSTASL